MVGELCYLGRSYTVADWSLFLICVVFCVMAMRNWLWGNTPDAMAEIAKYLDTNNENVKRGDLIASIRDLAQIAVSATNNCEQFQELLVNRRRCEKCGHVWGAYEDDCHCAGGECHNKEACQSRTAHCAK